MTVAAVSELRELVLTAVGAACGVDPGEIDVRARFNRLGLDSLRAARMIAGLAERLGRTLAPTLAWEHPTVDALVAYLSGAGAAGPGEGSPGMLAMDGSAGAHEPIAIVGMACRLPGAPDVPAFWRLLRDGVDAVGEVPAERGWDGFLAARGVTAAERAVVRRGGFLPAVDGFEPMFFGISPREAAAMDPQQRLMLELAWEAIEDAGVAPGSLAGTATGVFAGAIWSDYASLLYRRGPAALDQYTVTGSHASIIANRVSYALGLAGPSLTLDSACSSGLVVVHLACESLRRGESTLALAGAVNLNLRPDSALAVARFGALSPGGRCHTFDARADGYVRGEGGGVVALKTLARAIADGDPIRAVIRGSAVNNDGGSNGLTAPSRAAQEAVLAAACRRAGVRPGAVHYVEAHGTGTPLGDPIEARALGNVLGAGRPADAPLLVGSAKTNIGHAEGAAGIVGLIKVALAIEHRVVPPSLNFVSENPHAPLAELGLAVPTTARPWPSPEEVATAGVSSFGLGGTNGHVVVQAWPGPLPAAPAPVVGDGVRAGPGVVFVFPGQGAQWDGMARTLLHGEPVVRATLVACDRYIRRFAGWSLLAELSAAPGASRLGGIEVSLPAIIAVDIAVATWWRSVGVEPAAVVGHSTGEIAAAHVAGVLDLEDTMRTICAYGRFVGRFSGRGGMAFVGLPWAACAQALVGFEGRVFRAIEDSVEGTVVAGEPAALVELLAALTARGVFCRPVRMDVGPHSPLVDSVRDELSAALQDLRPRPASVPLISEVTGAEVDGRTLDAAHWVRNFGDPAFFSRAIDTLIERGHRLFLDVGPHPITTHSIEANLKRAGGGVVIASLRRDEDGRATLREAATALAGRGVAVRGDADRGDDGDDGAAWSLAVSARGPAALAARAADLAAVLADAAVRVRDVVFTAGVRREALEERLVVIGRSRAELVAGLSAFASDGTDDRERDASEAAGRSRDASETASRARDANRAENFSRGASGAENLVAGADGPEPAGAVTVRGRVRRAGPSRRVLVFAGQGSQWVGMGRALLAEEPVFRAEVALCDALVREQAGWSLLDELAAPEGRSRLHATEVAQPALFAVQVGLAALLAAWGVRPDAVIGQSAGEIAAAHVAGALTLEQAVRLVVLRGQILKSAMGRGTMAWVALPREAAARAIAGREAEVAIAAVNDPGSVLLSGGAALAEVLAELTARGVVHRPTRIDYASHGPQMDPLAVDLTRALGTVAARPAGVAIYSTVTGGRIAGEALDAAYWGRNLRATVELERAVARAYADGHRLFIEVGPHPVAAASLAQCLSGAQGEGRALHTLQRDGDERRDMLAVAGAVWVEGGEVELAALHPAGGRVVALPGYPWQRERHWVDEFGAAPRAGEHPLLGAPFSSALHPEERVWEQAALVEVCPCAAEHGLGEQAIVPGSVYLALVLAAGAQLHGGADFEVVDLRFERMLTLPCGPLQVGVVEGEADAAVTIASRERAGAWTRHVAAAVRRAGDGPVPGDRPAQIRGRCPAAVGADEHYAGLARCGVVYGPGLRSVTQVWLGDGEALGRVCAPADAGDAELADPAVLDGCLQVAMALVLARTGAAIPVGLARARLYGRAPAAVWVHARSDGERTDVAIVDDDGRVLGELSGLRCAPLADSFDPLADCAYQVVWRAAPALASGASDAGRGERAPWIVLGDAGGLGAALARALRRRGAVCVELAADGLAELSRLLDAPCRGVVCCGGLDATPWSETTPETLAADLRRGSLAAIEAAQAIVGRNLRDPPRLVLVTRGAQSVEGGPVAAAQAPLWGLARTLTLEHPELECLRVDLAPTPGADEAERLASELVAGDEETEVALRAGGRFVARMVRGRLDAAEPGAPALVADATYLITGGLGGLGLALAGWLAQRGARHLALVGRGAPSAGARAAIEAIEASGARVHVLQGDVAQAAEAARIVGEVQARLPPLRGVVHAAAVIGDRTVARMTAAEFWVPVRPKVLGAWNMHAATRGLALDFFVLYSSLTAVLGSLGQAAYAAGNAFLDALARARAAEGLAATSVQWGPHADVGMTTALGDRGARLTALGLASFTPAEGCALLGRLLARPQVEVGVARLSVRQWCEATPQAAGSRFLSELPREDGPARGSADVGLRERLAGASQAERAVLLADHVVEQLGKVLRLAPAKIDRSLPFARLGLDSLMSLELRNRLERSLAVKLPPTLCFTYPEVARLGEFLLQALGLGAADDDDVLAAFDASLRGLDGGSAG